MQPEEPSAQEPSLIEYDLWRWHTEGAFPKDQRPEQGYVHIGVFVTWLALHDMLHPGWVARSGAKRAVAAIRERSESPCALRDVTDGRLASDMLTAEGQGFTGAYYAPEYGYARDWRRVFGRRADRYAIPDEWETYDRIEALIELRHRHWIEAGRPELMPLPRDPRAGTCGRRTSRRRPALIAITGSATRGRGCDPGTPDRRSSGGIRRRAADRRSGAAGCSPPWCS
jgi:hypothetical protein